MHSRIFHALIIAVAALALFACSRKAPVGESSDPVLFQDSAVVDPNPAFLYEDAKFYFAWEDKRGDMKNAVVVLRIEDVNGESEFIEPKDVHIEGDTGGTIWFNLMILDGFQGTWYITVLDDSGNASNEIDLYLFVNPTPEDDDSAAAG